jgi:hypothetical protein
MRSLDSVMCASTACCATEYLNSEVIAELHAASCLRDEVQACRFQNRVVELNVTMPPLGVAAVTLQFAGRDRV